MDGTERLTFPLEPFWDLVERTYRDVFRQPEADRVKNLRSWLAGRPLEEQLQFYHDEPFAIAQDLLPEGTEPPPDAVERYLEVARELGRGGPDASRPTPT